MVPHSVQADSYTKLLILHQHADIQLPLSPFDDMGAKTTEV